MKRRTSGLAATTVLERDRLLDVESGKLLENRQILVEDRRIAAIGRTVDALAAAERQALGTCLPGLIDLHVHLDSPRASWPTSSRSTVTRSTTSPCCRTFHS